MNDDMLCQVKMPINAFKLYLLVLAVVVMPITCFADTATIAVASNFSHAAKALQKRFEQDSEHSLVLVFGATGKLYAQVRHGAPFDVFLSADSKTVSLLATQSLAIDESQFTYAYGQLALWVPSSELAVTEELLATMPTSAKLAIANHKLAPYGQAAEQVLDQLEASARFQRVQGENIAQTYQFVATGNAGLGLVAYSQLLNQDVASEQYWRVPRELHDSIQQDAALLSRASANRAAQAFMAFLQSDAARAIIRAHGYEVN